MLGKLVKYDLKWTYKPLVVFYILAFMASIIGRVMGEVDNSWLWSILSQICLGFAIAMMVNALINNLMRAWVRLIRNMYKDEAYLTHTLPVEKKTIYTAKILSAVISMLTTAVVIVICVAICYYSKENLEMLKTSVEFMANAYDSTVVSFLATVIVVIVLELLFALFAGYIGILIGHRANNLKMVKSIVFGFLAYMIPSAITLLAIYVIGLFQPEVMNLFYTQTTLEIETMKTVLLGDMVMYFVYIILYYWLGKKILEKGVNVD